MADHIQTLIAHYLATTYPSALDSFLRATGVNPPDPSNPPHPDLRTLANDYASNSLANQLSTDVRIDEKATDGSWSHWRAADVIGLELDKGVKLDRVVRSIDHVSSANLLSVCVAKIPKRTFDTSTASYVCTTPLSILISSVDKTVSVIEHESGEVSSILEPHKAAVLCIAIHPTRPRYLVTGSMDGSTVLTDLITQKPVQTFRSTKFVVKVAFSACGDWLATASYDKTVVLYRKSSDDEPEEVLDETDDPYLACEPNMAFTEHRRIKVEHNPEALLFTPAWLIYTTRSSHLMSYIRLDAASSNTSEIVTKSFNPHPLDTHVSFSVLNMALHPSGKVIACQTGDHAGSAGERILLYGVEPEETERLGCIWTGSETDDYVSPRMTWLPDGTGMITTSPNGLLHLLSLTGEIRSSLRVHGLAEGTIGSAGSGIIRDCAIINHGQCRWEVVSVGYDRIVRISQ